MPSPVRAPRLRAACIALAVVGVLAAAPRAAADQVTLKFNQPAPAAPVTVSYRDGYGSHSVTTTPGPYSWTVVTPAADLAFTSPTTTFCVELSQQIQAGNTYTFTTVTPITNVTGVSGTEANLITKLWGAHYAEATSGDATSATAFQLALWELVSDGNGSLKLTGSNAGNFKVTSADPDAVDLAKSWLAGLSSVSSSVFADNFAGYQLVWLSNGTSKKGSQDQLTMVKPKPPVTPPGGAVPAPAGLLLGLIGVGGCALGRRVHARA